METIDIEDLIPHRKRMKLVDNLLQAKEGEGVTTESRVRPDWPLCDGELLDPILLVELIAQSAAVYVGYKKRHEERIGGRGWLVGVRNSSLSTDFIPVGTCLQSRVEPMYELDNYAVYKGEVRAGEKTLAEIEVQVFRPDEFEIPNGD